GTQPLFTQVPPSLPPSTRATLAPYVTARRATAIPPDPPPTTTMSKCFSPMRATVRKTRALGYSPAIMQAFPEPARVQENMSGKTPDCALYRLSLGVPVRCHPCKGSHRTSHHRCGIAPQKLHPSCPVGELR